MCKDLKAAARLALTYLEAYERGHFIPADSVYQPGSVIGRLRNAIKRSDAQGMPHPTDPRLSL